MLILTTGESPQSHMRPTAPYYSTPLKASTISKVIRRLSSSEPALTLLTELATTISSMSDWGILQFSAQSDDEIPRSDCREWVPDGRKYSKVLKNQSKINEIEPFNVAFRAELFASLS